MSVPGAIAAVALFWLVSYVPGWAVARAGRLRADLFTRLWIGLALTSVLGLFLGASGRFTLAALLIVVAALAIAALARPRTAVDTAMETRAADAGKAALAAVAALAVVLWSWPPYETVIAASDSTMYVNAGVHLARTGRFTVPQTLSPLLPGDAAGSLFASIGWYDVGPFVRLPGGLLMPTRTAAAATPAFFPLLPIWAAVLALAGGPMAATLVAPLFSALAVASVVLFAGETLGAGVAVATALMMVANFAVWWYAKFAMPEPLAAAAIWAGFVFLHRAGAGRDRRIAFLAGAVLGLAGLARTESFLFVLAAGALAFAWSGLRAPVLPLLFGFASMLGVAALAGEHSPSHHLAYLRNELLLHYLAILPWLTAARANGLVLLGGVLFAALLALAGVVAVRAGTGFVRGVLRVAAPLAALAGLVVYARLGGRVFPARDLSWLALYCSWPLLALAALGAPLAWSRGGDAVRFAGYAWLLATAVFVLNPRVADYHPWAIRRFLPLVIPGVVIAGAAAVAWTSGRAGRAGRVLALAVLAVVVVLEVRPVLRVRALPYYQGNFALVAALAARFPADAVIAMESQIAELQLQVPLWLMTGRETIMLHEGGRRWQRVMRALAASGHPVFWIGSGRRSPSKTGDVELRPLGPDVEIGLVVPDAPGDATPSRKVTRLVTLRIYGVAVGEGSGDDAVGEGIGFSRRTSMRLTSANFSGVTAASTRSTRYISPVASRPKTYAWYWPTLSYVCDTSSPVTSGEPSPKFHVKVNGGVPFRACAVNCTGIGT